MAARDVRKQFHLFVDGRGYLGEATELNAPKLTLKTEDFRAGGMIAPIKLTMGMEALTCDFTLVSYDAALLAAFSVREGSTIPITIREVLESYDGTINAAVHTIRGKITEIDPGTSKPGDVPSLKITVSADYYRLIIGGAVIHEIDIANMTQVIDGVDILAVVTQALGI